MKHEDLYNNEADCFKKIIKIIHPEGLKCKKCGGKDFWFKPERRIVICKQCRFESSPLSKSMFSRSHIKLHDWFRLIKMVTMSPERVVTALSTFNELGLGSYRTVWEALNKIRFVISFNEPRRKLQGVIEFDELVVAGIGSEYRKISILGALEIEGEKRLSLQMIKNPDEMNIKDYLKRRFKKDATVICDSEKLYIRNWLELNRIQHKSPFLHYGNNFMNIHIVLQDVRFGLKNGHHGISEKYLQRNLDEYVFTFNHNDNREKAFNIALEYMALTPLIEYRKAEKKKSTILSIIRGDL